MPKILIKPVHRRTNIIVLAWLQATLAIYLFLRMNDEAGIRSVKHVQLSIAAVASVLLVGVKEALYSKHMDRLPQDQDFTHYWDVMKFFSDGIKNAFDITALLTLSKHTGVKDSDLPAFARVVIGLLMIPLVGFIKKYRRDKPLRERLSAVQEDFRQPTFGARAVNKFKIPYFLLVFNMLYQSLIAYVTTDTLLQELAHENTPSNFPTRLGVSIGTAVVAGASVGAMEYFDKQIGDTREIGLGIAGSRIFLLLIQAPRLALLLTMGTRGLYHHYHDTPSINHNVGLSLHVVYQCLSLALFTVAAQYWRTHSNYKSELPADKKPRYDQHTLDILGKVLEALFATLGICTMLDDIPAPLFWTALSLGLISGLSFRLQLPSRIYTVPRQVLSDLISSAKDVGACVQLYRSFHHVPSSPAYYVPVAFAVLLNQSLLMPLSHNQSRNWVIRGVNFFRSVVIAAGMVSAGEYIFEKFLESLTAEVTLPVPLRIIAPLVGATAFFALEHCASDHAKATHTASLPKSIIKAVVCFYALQLLCYQVLDAFNQQPASSSGVIVMTILQALLSINIAYVHHTNKAGIVARTLKAEEYWTPWQWVAGRSNSAAYPKFCQGYCGERAGITEPLIQSYS